MNLFNSNNSNNNFVIAAPRSGTTWLSTMLNAHKDVLCIERRLFGNYADFVLDDCQKVPRLRVTLDKYVNSLLLHHGYPENKQDVLMRAFIANLVKEEKRFSGKKNIVDKITPYLNTADTVIAQINTYFPKAKIIYLVRDGRDVLTSGVFHWFNKQKATSVLKPFELKRRQLFLENSEVKMGRFFQDSEIIQWANEWAQPLKTIEIAEKSHSIKIIRFEELLINPENVMKECLSFLSANNSKATVKNCIDAGNFNKMSKGRKQGEAKQNAHVRKGISGDWENYFTYEDGKLFHEIAGDILIKFGYEENENWFERLR